MKKTTLYVLFLFSLVPAFAQGVSTYSFAESTESYVTTNGTNSTAIGDDGSENDIPIGFDFDFGTATYTTFSISTNGFIRLGSPIGQANWTNSLAVSAAQAPLIAPFWDDHNRNNGSISYQIFGTAPNRTLEVDWNSVTISNGGVASDNSSASFKLRLYESNGKIEFVYGASMTTISNPSASIGLNDLTSFVSVSPDAVSTSSTTIANNDVNSTENIIGKKYTFIPQPACVIPLVAGDAIATSGLVCHNSEFTLSQNTFYGYEATFQWQQSTDNVTYENVAGLTSSEITLSQTTAKYYRVVVTCGGATVTSTPVLVSMNSINECYCEPFYGTGKTDGDLISNVVIAGTSFSNLTGAEPVNPFYTIYTGEPNYTASLQPGVSYSMTVTVGTYGQQNVSVWIDYNDDGVFSEGERVGYSTQMINGSGSGTFSILIPCDAPSGLHRMRIRDVYNVIASTIDPCMEYQYGEAEDYEITIIPAQSCQQPFGLAIGQINSTSALLTWISACGSTSYDLYIQPAGEPAPTGTPSNPSISGTSFIATLLSPSTAYDFYVRANCEDDLSSSLAGPFAFTTAPPAVGNDECETAYSLIPGGSFEDNALVATNIGASKSIGPPNPTCSGFGFGGDVWFAIAVPDSGNLTVETKSNEGSPIVDTVMTLFSGACSSLTTLECDDDDGDGGFSKISYSGLAPGSTVHLRVWEYANDTTGTFRVSAYDSTLSTSDISKNGFSFYPNPVRNILTLSGSEAIKSVVVYNMVGQQVMVQNQNANMNQIDMSSLPQATYLVKITSASGQSTFTIIKE